MLWTALKEHTKGITHYEIDLFCLGMYFKITVPGGLFVSKSVLFRFQEWECQQSGKLNAKNVMLNAKNVLLDWLKARNG